MIQIKGICLYKLFRKSFTLEKNPEIHRFFTFKWACSGIIFYF